MKTLAKTMRALCQSRVLTLLVALTAIVGAQAQTQDNAIYVYRNDGKFNAFLHTDLKQVILSKVDDAGTVYNDFVVQEFHTIDSVYRIPLAVIDSVSFVQPETKYKSNVCLMNQDWDWYIQEVTASTIRLSNQISAEKLPKTGDILASMYVSDKLMGGFAGKVTSVEHLADRKSYLITCDPNYKVGLDDIFEQLVYVGSARTNNYEATANEYNQSSAPHRIPHLMGDYDEAEDPATPSWLKDVNWNATPNWQALPLTAPGTRTDGEGSFSLPTMEFPVGPMSFSLDYSIDVHFAIAIGMFEHPHVSMSAIQHVSGNCNLGTGDDLKATWNHVWWKNVYTYYIPQVPGLGISLTPGLFLDFKAGMEFTAGVDIKTKRVTRFQVDENENYVDFYDMPYQITPKVSGAVNFEASFGPCLELSIVYISKDVCSLDAAGFLGAYAKAEANVTWAPADDLTSTQYRLMKDTKLEAGIWAAGFLGAHVAAKKLSFTKPYEFKPSDELPDFSLVIRKPLIERYLFPEFKAPMLKQEENTGYVEANSTPSRDLFVSVPIGFALYDVERKQFTEETFLPNEYSGEDWKEKNALTAVLKNVKVGKKYKVAPYLKYKMYKLVAEPQSAEIEIEGKVITQGATADESQATLTGKVLPVMAKDGRKLSCWFYYGSDPSLELSDKTDTKLVYADNIDPETGVFTKAVTGLNPSTKYYLQAHCSLDGIVLPYRGEIVPFTTQEHVVVPTKGKPVDLGLPSGTCWADHNFGAAVDTDPGYYYAWGELKTKKEYTEKNSQWYGYGPDAMKRMGVVDDDIVLTLEYDIANREWGKDWFIPTLDDVIELINNCDVAYGTKGGVKGAQFTGPNGNKIFIPYSGAMSGSSLQEFGVGGYYWTADAEDDKEYAITFCFENYEEKFLYDFPRYFGFTIRPVYWVNENKPDAHDYVDLGLSVLWATCNVGAEKPEDFGDYFAYGETKPKSTYTEENWYLRSENMTNNFGQSEDVDMLDQIYQKNGDYFDLKPAYDAATVNWGDPWRMPTYDEMQELVEKCKWEPVQNEKNHRFIYYKVTGPSGKHIILPIAGSMHEKLYNEQQAFFRTRSCYSRINTQGSFLWLYPFIEWVKYDNWGGPSGMSVRPVMDKPKK